jgi:hypothetical protein
MEYRAGSRVVTTVLRLGTFCDILSLTEVTKKMKETEKEYPNRHILSLPTQVQ